MWHVMFHSYVLETVFSFRHTSLRRTIDKYCIEFPQPLCIARKNIRPRPSPGSPAVECETSQATSASRSPTRSDRHGCTGNQATIPPTSRWQFQTAGIRRHESKFHLSVSRKILARRWAVVASVRSGTPTVAAVSSCSGSPASAAMCPGNHDPPKKCTGLHPWGGDVVTARATARLYELPVR